jgi:lysosomal acid lipase/cholesteryl ester hydrolase
MTFHERVQSFGFKSEEHSVTTQDGYILTIFRIPGRLDDQSKHKKHPVYFQHGLVDSADSWILRGMDSVGMSLANAGYDVWFGNFRGSTHSKDHINPDI